MAIKLEDVVDVFRTHPKQDRALVGFRRNFIAISNLLSFVVLLGLLIFSTVANYNQQVVAVNRALDAVVVEKLREKSYDVSGYEVQDEAESSAEEPKNGIQIYPDGSGGIRLEDSLESPRSVEEDGIVATITYFCEPGGTPEIEGASANLSDDVIEQAVGLVAGYTKEDAGRVSQGSIGILGLRYAAYFGEGGEFVVVFASGNFVKHSVVSLLFALGVPILAVQVLIFFASILLSYAAVRPLEESWKRQQRFVADASHELKTPLSVIMASNSLMQASPDATVASQKRWTDTIGNESARMLELVNDMLFLARSNSVASRAEFETLDFSQLVLGEVLQFESLAFERGVGLSENIMEGIYVRGEAKQLKRLVGILIDNACKYAGSGGEAEVVLLKWDITVVLHVRNNGPNIPEEDLPYIFDRFYRADKARNRQQGGFGLGLAIAKDVVETHSGTIGASNEGEWTCFTVRLPYAVR